MTLCSLIDASTFGMVVHAVSYQPLKNLHGQLQLCRHESPDVSNWHLAFSQQGYLAWRIAEEDCKQMMPLYTTKN